MRKLLTATMLAIGMSVTGALADLQTKTEQMFTPSVQISNSCSGTLISSQRDSTTGDVETLVLTAKHCHMRSGVNDAIDIRMHEYNDQNRRVMTKSYRGVIYRVDFRADLSLIKLRDTDTWFGDRVANLAPEDRILTFGDEVHMVGYPMGKSMTYTMGHLGFVEDDMFGSVSNSGEFYRATPDSIGGSSGSPLYRANDDGDYEVIGVLTGGYTGNSYMNLYTPLNEVHDFLKRSRLDVKEIMRQ